MLGSGVKMGTTEIGGKLSLDTGILMCKHKSSSNRQLNTPLQMSPFPTNLSKCDVPKSVL